jgi:hypothetical protein
MGDITAMYTNINKDSSCNIVKGMFESLKLHDGKVDTQLQAVELANNDNYMEFNNRLLY